MPILEADNKLYLTTSREHREYYARALLALPFWSVRLQSNGPSGAPHLLHGMPVLRYQAPCGRADVKKLRGAGREPKAEAAACAAGETRMLRREWLRALYEADGGTLPSELGDCTRSMPPHQCQLQSARLDTLPVQLRMESALALWIPQSTAGALVQDTLLASLFASHAGSVLTAFLSIVALAVCCLGCALRHRAATRL